MSHFSILDTAKLTTAPIVAKTTVSINWADPIWSIMMSKVPPAVPDLMSWLSIVFCIGCITLSGNLAHGCGYPSCYGEISSGFYYHEGQSSGRCYYCCAQRSKY